MKRRITKVVNVGSLSIGGGEPIAIQSMTNTDTRDVKSTEKQIQRLVEAGCEIVRLAVPDESAALALKQIKSRSAIPIVADIHFDHRLALLAMENGVDKLRINPGNIGSEKKIAEVVSVAKERQIPIRIGVNSGSLSKRSVEKFGRSADAMVESALEHVAILENHGFSDIVISMKATDIAQTLAAYKIMSDRVEYPLHIGITEAGTKWFGTIKSAAGLGAILSHGIGDTIRISLTADPVEEVKVAWALLSALEIRRRGPVFISCPTCGRTEIPLLDIAKQVEERLSTLQTSLTIAIMGCPVNGPGEAREADLGIAGGQGVGVIFRKGTIIRKVPEDQLVDALVAEARLIAENDV